MEGWPRWSRVHLSPRPLLYGGVALFLFTLILHTCFPIQEEGRVPFTTRQSAAGGGGDGVAGVAGPHPPTHIVSLFGVTRAEEYAWLAPFAAAAWLRCGVEPHVVLVGSEDEWSQHDTPGRSPFREVVTALHAIGAPVYFLPTSPQFAFLGDDPLPVLSKTIRLVPYAFPGVDEDDVVIMADVDLLPLRCHYFCQRMALNVLNGSLWADAEAAPSKRPHNETRWAMCYMAAKARIWKEITAEQVKKEEQHDPVAALHSLLHANGEFLRAVGAKDFDELWMSERILQWDARSNGLLAKWGTANDHPLRRVFDRDPLGPHPYKGGERDWSAYWTYPEHFQTIPTLVDAMVGPNHHSLVGRLTKLRLLLPDLDRVTWAHLERFHLAFW